MVFHEAVLVTYHAGQGVPVNPGRETPTALLKVLLSSVTTREREGGDNLKTLTAEITSATGGTLVTVEVMTDEIRYIEETSAMTTASTASTPSELL
jgi:hypothetical protein